MKCLLELPPLWALMPEAPLNSSPLAGIRCHVIEGLPLVQSTEFRL